MLVLCLAFLFSNELGCRRPYATSRPADCAPPCSFFIVGASSIIFLLGVSSLRPVLRSAALFASQIAAALPHCCFSTVVLLLRCAVFILPCTLQLGFYDFVCVLMVAVVVSVLLLLGRLCASMYHLKLLLRCAVLILPCALQLCVYDTISAVRSMPSLAAIGSSAYLDLFALHALAMANGVAFASRCHKTTGLPVRPGGASCGL